MIFFVHVYTFGVFYLRGENIDNVKLVNWGNSKAIRIPIAIIQQLILNENQLFEIKVQNEHIQLIPKQEYPETIYELFADYNGKAFNYSEEELDWGEAKGEGLEW
ncbi:AbrB/MazE/SpoVT family DNA-binding domain-containing protein [Fundicoccus sp. Sow4_H7]|uniref:AbrB/MazE/SpoVT family DNA-binding domain-containing protein n=1 Tax=Fundicoccus sp. Sow4_H7 TaxID=3438784 RepID=UPI003F8DB4E1